MKPFRTARAFGAMTAAHFGIIKAKDSQSRDNSHWMADIPDTKRLGELSIPATHDSFAMYEPFYGVAKCQKLSFTDQLNVGVRAFDIRCGALGKGIYLLHGPVYQAKSFDGIIDDCRRFLAENPSEALIFTVKEEFRFGRLSKDLATAFEKYIQAYPDLWYTANSVPALGEVRGKILLINRIGGSYRRGIMTSWGNNTTFEFETENCTVHVQDFYHVPTVADKWNEAKAMLDKCADTDLSCNMFINYLSGYEGILPQAEKVSDIINACFSAYASEGNAPLGTVAFDMVTKELCDAVIEKNFI